MKALDVGCCRGYGLLQFFADKLRCLGNFGFAHAQVGKFHTVEAAGIVAQRLVASASHLGNNVAHHRLQFVGIECGASH